MIDRSLVRTLVGFLLGSGAFAGLCFGQAGRGGISGLITDATSALVPGAKVKLVNLATGVNLEGISTSAGLYSFTALAPGNYRISVAMEGFQTVVRELIPVEADRVSGVDIELKPGAVSETVTVEGEPALMNTTNSTIGQLITNKTLDSLPMNGRNVFLLVQLTPGVVPINGSLNQTGAFTPPGLACAGSGQGKAARSFPGNRRSP